MSKTFAPGSACLYADQAQHPAVSLNSSNNFVAVHQDAAAKNVYYKLGEIECRTFLFGTSAVFLASGSRPMVALKDGSANNFVIFAFVDASKNLCVYCGEVSFGHNTIDFSRYNSGAVKVLTDSGTNITNVAEIALAINKNGSIVLVYSDTDENLHIKTGYVNEANHTLSWSTSTRYRDNNNKVSGIHPAVAMSSDNKFVILHQSENFDSLYYNMGTVGLSNGATSLTFTLTDDVEYLSSSSSPSTSPGVAINSSGMVFEVHEASYGYDLYFQNGALDFANKQITKFTEDDSTRYFDSYHDSDDLKARNPAVALNDNGWAIHVYESYSNKLFMAVALNEDRCKWMAHYTNRTLGSLVIPGSHDAGMSEINNFTGGTADSAKTQIQDIAYQLNAGIRYFDIRPIFDSMTDSSQIWTGHYSPPGFFFVGAEGQQMKQVLSQVNDFITQSTSVNEVVILKFSHFIDTQGANHYFSESAESDSDKQTLIDLLTSLIDDEMKNSYLYVHDPSGPRITEKKLSEITNGKGKVILLYDLRDLKNISLPSYACTYMDMVDPDTMALDPNVTKASADWVMYDNYSKTPDVNVMVSRTADNGQVSRMMNAANHAGDMYLCSWTLTLTTGMSMNPDAFSILENAQNANGVLAQDMLSQLAKSAFTADLLPNILYVDAADGFVSDVVKSMNNTADAWLTALAVSGHSISPVFSPRAGSYQVNVSGGTSEVAVTATASDDKATIAMNGHIETSGQPVTVGLDQGANVITILVTAQNGVTTKTYTLTITRG